MTGRSAGETPPVPKSVRGAYSTDQLVLLERYVEWLAQAGVERGLIGPREAPRLWSRHIVNCALPASRLPAAGEICDVGSGAGLPGIVLAIVRKDLSFTLVEPLLRRSTFLDEVVAELELHNVEVVRGRAEDLHGVMEFDVVCSRAVAPLDRLVRWCLPLCRPSGRVMAMKGSKVRAEVHEHASALQKCGAGKVEITELVPEDGSEPTFVAEIPWAEPGRVCLPNDAIPAASGRWRTSKKRKSRRPL